MSTLTVADIVADQLGFDRESVRNEHVLVNLGADSLDFVEIILAIEADILDDEIPEDWYLTRPTRRVCGGAGRDWLVTTVGDLDALVVAIQKEQPNDRHGVGRGGADG